MLASPPHYSHDTQDWPSYVPAPGPSYWLFLTKGRWGACPSTVSLVTNKPTWHQFPDNWWTATLPIPTEVKTDSMPIICCTKSLQDLASDFKFPHPLNHWCLCYWLWALSSVLKLEKHRVYMPVECSPAELLLEMKIKNNNLTSEHNHSLEDK